MFEAEDPRVKAIADQVITEYNRPLPYHNAEHIAACFEEMTSALGDRTDEEALLAMTAITYHDIVYVPGAWDNEVNSADRARKDVLLMIDEDGTDEEKAEHTAFADRVAEAIIKTARHTEDQTDLSEGEQLVLDVDMAVLAGTPEQYAAYTEAMRQEYLGEGTGITAEQYRTGRAQFLERLLGREKIYYHPLFQEREETARVNIRQELAQLRQPVNFGVRGALDSFDILDDSYEDFGRD